MLFRILTFGIHHRTATAVLLALVTAAAAMGLLRLRVDTGYTSLIPSSDPRIPAYERVAEEFGADNRTLVYVRDEALWTPLKLAALEELHYALEGLGFVTRVDDVFTLGTFRGNRGVIDYHVLLAEAPLDQAEAEKALADALHNPLVADYFVARDGTATALLVTLDAAEAEKLGDRRIDAALEHVLQPFRPIFGDVFQVGPPRIGAELTATLLDDLERLGPLSALLLAAAVLAFLRSGFAALVPLVTSAVSLVWTFGAMGWAGIPLNVLSAMLPSLVVVIGSTEDVHMITAYFAGLRQAPETDYRPSAARYMVTHLGIPLLLTVLTTAMGFASNLFSGMEIIRQFAAAATFAILANGVVTVFFVPMALAAAGPGKPGGYGGDGRVGGIPAVFVRLFRYSNRRCPRLVLVLTALLCAFFVFQLSKLTVSNDPLSYFKPDRPLIREIDRIHGHLAGIQFFFITLDSERENAFQEPANIARIVDIQQFLAKQGVFDGSISLADYLALVNRAFHGGDEDDYEVPKRRDLVAQYLLFFQRRDLESYVSHDYRRANIVVRHHIRDSHKLNRYVAELEAVAAHFAGNDIRVHVLGENIMVNAAAEDLMLAQVKSLGLLLAVIFLLMSAMFTSFKGGLISLFPSLIPIVLMFGVMGFLDIPLNPGTAMVAVIAVGIAIDGTIHLLSRYNDLCRRTSDYGAAVHAAVEAEATPMVVTSLALALGFGVLLASNFAVIAQFGALSAATMLFALFANLLITPIIMSRVRLVGLYQILALSMHKEVLQKSPLFRGMSAYQMRKAILISELNEFRTGDLLVEQGTVGRSMYLILEGQVEVVRRDNGGGRRVATLEAGDIFGEIGYVREIRRTADVRATRPVEVLRFDFRKLQKDLKFFPYTVASLNFNISCILGERLAEAMEKAPPGDSGQEG